MYRIISFAFTVNLTVFLHYSKYSHRYAMRTVCITRDIKRIVQCTYYVSLNGTLFCSNSLPWFKENIRPTEMTRGRILGRNWDKSLESFPPCYSQSPLLMDFALMKAYSWAAENCNKSCVVLEYVLPVHRNLLESGWAYYETNWRVLLEYSAFLRSLQYLLFVQYIFNWTAGKWQMKLFIRETSWKPQDQY